MQCTCAILSCVACPALQYFSTLSHKTVRFFFGGGVTEHKMCVLIYSTKFETFLILRTTEQDMIKNVYCPSSKAPIILVRYYLNLNFLNSFLKNTQITKINENPSSGSRVHCRQADRQTDVTKLTVAFRNYANAPKN